MYELTTKYPSEYSVRVLHGSTVDQIWAAREWVQNERHGIENLTPVTLSERKRAANLYLGAYRPRKTTVSDPVQFDQSERRYMQPAMVDYLTQVAWSTFDARARTGR